MKSARKTGKDATPRLRPLFAIVLAAVVALAGCREKPEEMVASAKSYLAKNDRNAAAIQLKNALQQNGSLAEARFLLGEIHLQQGDVASAAKELRRAAELGYSPVRTSPLLARAMLRTGDADGVIKEFAGRTLDDPAAQAQLLTVLGDAYLAKADVAKARSAYDGAIAADPHDALARVGVARLRLAGGDAPGALADADAIVAEQPASAEAQALRAEALLAAKRPDEAEQALAAAIEAAPRNVNYHYALISLLLRENKIDEAATRLAAMQKAAPAHPLTGYLQASIDLRRGRLDEARDGILKVLKVIPDNLPAQTLAGTVFLRQGDQPRAQDYLGKVIASAPRAVLPRRLMAMSLLGTREPARAIEVLQPLLEGGDEDPVTLNLAGEAYLANGDFDRAEEYFGRLAKAAPDDAQVRTRLGVARLAAGDAEAAFADLEAASALKADSGQAETALVLAHTRRKEFDKALAAVARLEQKQPGQAQTYILKGGVLLAKNDVAGARAAFDKALAVAPDSLAAALNLARLDLFEKRPDDARRRFDAFLERNPNNTRALLAKADVVARSGGKPDEILALLERATKADAAALAPKLALVSFYLGQQQPKKALAQAQDAAAANPNDPQAVTALARSQLAAGDTQQAAESFGRLARLLPSSPAPLLELADVQYKAGDADGAERSLRQAVALKPQLVAARQRLIALLVERKRTDQALEVARDVQKLDAKSPVGYVFEGDIQSAGGAWDAAAAALRKALPLDPSGQAAAKLYAALARGGKTAEAQKTATDWLAKHPQDVVLRSYLAQHAMASRQYEEAGRLYRKVVDIAPNDAIALNNLAWVAGQLGDPKAISYAEQALAKAPGNPAILDTLGSLQVARGMAEEGLANQRKAVALAPKAAPLRLSLARSYVRLQRKDDARKELDVLLGEAPADSPLRAEASRLREGL